MFKESLELDDYQLMLLERAVSSEVKWLEKQPNRKDWKPFIKDYTELMSKLENARESIGAAKASL